MELLMTREWKKRELYLQDFYMKDHSSEIKMDQTYNSQ
jgi:hypothetical protein